MQRCSHREIREPAICMYNVIQIDLLQYIENLLSGLRKRHADERWTQCFCIHFHAGAAQILIRPNLHVR